MRQILVTGASSGIGRAISETLLAEGYSVVGIARDFSKFACEDARFIGETLDLSQIDELPRQLQELVKKYAAIDGIICSAGSGRFGSLEEFSYVQIRALMELNFLSHAYLVRAFLPLLKQRKRSDLIFIGSEAALSGSRQGAIYCASKFALRGMAQALREECARSGVRVCVINPGMVKTGFFDQLHFKPGDDKTNYVLPEDVANAVAMVLAARAGTVYDEINLSPLKKVVQFRTP
jgi:3-hydroxy acid dehydrogenase/malonic semialdehyde reductase